MKYIFFIAVLLFSFTPGYSQSIKAKGKLFIKGVPDFLIRKSQLNDSLELVTDLKVDAIISVTVYWSDSLINRVKTATLFNGLIPKYILSEWKQIPSDGKIIFDEPKCFDKNKNEFIPIEAFIYAVIN